MKKLIVAGILAVSTTAAIAQPFEFQERIGSQEYDPYSDTRGMSFAPVTKTGRVSSYEALIQSANVDGIAFHDFKGEIIRSGPTRISLYEVLRDSSEGIAYRDYHERYPENTDWDAVANDYRQQQELAGASPFDGDNS